MTSGWRRFRVWSHDGRSGQDMIVPADRRTAGRLAIAPAGRPGASYATHGGHNPIEWRPQ